jgi:hypothetical protein
VGDVQSLSRNVFEDFANAVQQNISITELELTVDGNRSSFHAAEIDSASEVVLIRLFDCLCQRRASLDVLALQVSNFTASTWDCLWKKVVPSQQLNLKCLELLTGTPGEEFDVDEDLMTRSICASTRLCEFPYRNCLRDEVHLETINNTLIPYLNFNRFRRLVIRIEQVPDVALQARWFATALSNSIAQRNPAWCYFLLKRNAGDFLSESN